MSSPATFPSWWWICSRRCSRIREGQVDGARRHHDQAYRRPPPDIPTLAEGGLAGYELVAWQGVVAPAGTPCAIVDSLAAQIAKLLADSATRDKLTNIAIEPLAGSTRRTVFAAYIKNRGSIAGRRVVRNSGAEAE